MKIYLMILCKLFKITGLTFIKYISINYINKFKQIDKFVVI